MTPARKEVINMIELFLSSDGKHTVHVSADTPEQLAELAPKAKALFEKVLVMFGTKAEMGEAVINNKANGHAQVGKRVDTVEQAREAVVPHAPCGDGVSPGEVRTFLVLSSQGA